MIELLQLWSMVHYGEIHCLFLFLIVFVLSPIVIMRIRGRKYKIYQSNYNEPFTVIVPVYKEDYQVFENCMESIAKQNPEQIIVAIDSNDGELMRIATKYGAELLKFDKRGGKRKAMAEAWSYARNEIIVQVDSDVVLLENCVKELIKPFADNKIVGVSSNRIPVRGKSNWAWICSSIVETNSNIVAKSLDGALIVIDGRCNAYRKNFLLSVKHGFLNDIWLGIRGEIGEDRFLTREALRQGYKVVYQETSKELVITPDSFMSFLKQQLRWARSGVKYFLLDIKDGLFPTRTYLWWSVAYYISPFVFLIALGLDQFMFPLDFVTFNWYVMPFIIIFGTTLVLTLKQTLLLGKPMSWLYLPIQATIGLFLLYPITIYANFTAHRQDLWVTRQENKLVSFSKETISRKENIVQLIQK